VRKDWAS